jgi:hypothetical protein
VCGGRCGGKRKEVGGIRGTKADVIVIIMVVTEGMTSQ